MRVFWEIVIEPLIEALAPKVILEIGSDEGANTRLLLAAGAPHDRTLHSIDPKPRFDVAAVQEQYGDRFVPHFGLSLDVLPTIEQPFDLVLIDGDHNWYTVLNELRLLERQATSRNLGFPLVVLHDIRWPYGRRDLYHDPSTIPVRYRNPYRKAGMRPGQGELCDGGGLNPHFHQATMEGGPANGVLTGLEDFLAETAQNLELLEIPVWHGLGIVFGSHHRAEHPEFARFLSELTPSPIVRRLMEEGEAEWLRRLIEVRDQRREYRALCTKMASEDRERGEERARQAGLQSALFALSALLSDSSARWVAAQADLGSRLDSLTDSHERLRAEAAAALSRAETERERAEARLRRVETRRLWVDAGRRKLRKLRRDPVQFFRDSPIVQNVVALTGAADGEPRQLGEPELGAVSSPIDRGRRKLRKLRRDPIRFFRDASIVRRVEAWSGATNRDRRRPEVGFGPAPAGSPGARRRMRKLRKLARDPVGFVKDARIFRPSASARLRAERELIRTSDLFDADYYASQDPDASRSGVDPIERYLLVGVAAGYDPHPDFNTAFYLATNPDVRKAGQSPLVHYLRSGQSEGRPATPSSLHTRARLVAEIDLVRGSRLFDADYYLSANPDVARLGVDPVEHFAERGWCEGRNPSPRFDVEYYLAANPDLRRAGMNPLYHYLRFGAAEGHAPRPLDEGEVAALRVAARAWARSTNRRFSVVMPTWNRRATIARAVDSVLAQSYRQFELIISDDGSTDGTRELVERAYPEPLATGRIVWLDNPHRGVSAARNAGLAAATGDWIAYLDSDNTWREHYLLLMGHALASNPDRRVAYAQLEVHDHVHDKEFVRKRHFDRQSLRVSNYIDLNIYVHARSLYQELGGFDEGLTRLVDWDLILRQLDQETPVYVAQVLCDYFLSAPLNNITHAEPLERNRLLIREKLDRRALDRARCGLRRRRLGILANDVEALSTPEIRAKVDSLAQQGYAVTRLALDTSTARSSPPSEIHPVTGPADLARVVAEHQLTWCHAHLLSTPGLAALESSAVAGFSFRPPASDIFSSPVGATDALADIAQGRRCCAVMVDNAVQEEVLVARGVPRHKVVRSPLPFVWRGAPRVPADVRARRPGAPLEVLALSPLVAESGLMNLVEACRELDGVVRVRIAGEGPQAERLRALIGHLGVGSVELVGAAPDGDARRALLRSADLFVFPYAPSWHAEYDGVPPVVLEAVDEGTPVLATTTPATYGLFHDRVSGFTVPVADSEAIAARLREVARLPAASLARIGENARAALGARVGCELSAHALSRAIHPSLDIVLVATDGISWSHFTTLVEELLVLTTTRFSLRLVDNGCSKEKADQIQRMAAGRPNVEVLRLDEMVGLGIASNFAFERCTAEHIIYLCANEGAVVGRGWERPILDYMVTHPQVALAGTLVSSPKWLTGEEYAKQEWFQSFRAQELALAQPSREFSHVQGGLYILRREVFREHGGFSVAHDYMDVEYSYYLESKGCHLGSVPSILSLSAKTRPTLLAHLDEHVTAVHPVLTPEEMRLIRGLADPGDLLYCNLRGALLPVAPGQDDLVEGRVDPASGSHGFGRALYRYLALSGLAHRGASARVRLPEGARLEQLGQLFASVDTLDSSASDPLAALRTRTHTDLLIVHSAPASWLARLAEVFGSLGPTGRLICSFASPEPLASEVSSEAGTQGFRCERIAFQSRRVDYGLRGIYVFRRATEPRATEPRATEPRATEPRATEPRATEPRATEPRATEPRATEPRATTRPSCNICGAQAFGLGPGGRHSANGKPPRCTRCQSLERHRALRWFWSSIPAESLRDCTALQFSRDLSVEPKRFRQLELSVYLGENSLDLQRIDRPSRSYDVVICNHVLEHVADDVAALRELLRVIRPDGWLLLSVPDPVGCRTMREWGSPDPTQHGHYRIYSLEGLLERIGCASPEMKLLLLPTQDPVTGQFDCALACSHSTATLDRLKGFYRPLAPDAHPFELSMLGARAGR